MVPTSSTMFLGRTTRNAYATSVPCVPNPSSTTPSLATTSKHIRDVQFDCGDCGRAYKNYLPLSSHKTQCQKNEFQCRRENGSLQNPISTAHALSPLSTEILFSCEFCGTSFQAKRNLSKHHTGRSCILKWNTKSLTRESKIVFIRLEDTFNK